MNDRSPDNDGTEKDTSKKGLGSFIGLIAFFIIGLLIIAFILWPVLSPPVQGQ